jgi:hypothetical protein
MKWFVRFALLAAAAILPACHEHAENGAAPITINILAKGGEGKVNSGNLGGRIIVYNESGTGVRILKSGAVSASVDVPDVVPDLGLNPRTVASDTLLVTNESNQIIGDDGMNIATGLWIKPGATARMASACERMYFEGGVFIEGAIESAISMDEPGHIIRNNLDIYAANLVVTKSGKINASGLDANDETGGNSEGFHAEIWGTIINKGAINASGGVGILGGNGGTVDLISFGYGVYNTGSIIADGGQGADGSSGVFGGSGGHIRLFGNTVGAFNMGSLSAVGGNSAEVGGHGGTVDLSSGGGILKQSAPQALLQPPIMMTGGIVTNAGTIDVSGGNGVDLGGNAGDIGIDGSVYRVAGALLARGGQGGTMAGGDRRKAEPMEGTMGGQGGGIFIGPQSGGLGKTLNASGVGVDPNNPAGDCAVGAQIDVSGGAADNGNVAGEVIILKSDRYYYDYPDGYNVVYTPNTPLYLLNYASIDASGGDGKENGGNAGDVGIANGVVWDYSDYIYDDIDKPSKPASARLQPGYAGVDPSLVDAAVINEVALTARGGKGVLGHGGYNVNAIQLINNAGYANNVVLNSGAIDMSGGEGKIYGGGMINKANPAKAKALLGPDPDTDVLGVYIFSQGDVTNSAPITTSGGDSTGGDGGYALPIFIDSYGQVSNTATLTANGGNSSMVGTTDEDDMPIEFFGGGGGSIVVFGLKVRTTGSLIAKGGNATTGNWGGQGGYIEVASGETPSETHTLSVDGGTPNGALGEIWVDGVQLVAAVPRVYIDAFKNYAIENIVDDTGTFRISRYPTDTDMTVTVTLGGTATPTTDYTLTPAITTTVTIPAFQNYVDVIVTPVNDLIDEPGGETVILRLVPNPAQYQIGNSSAALVRIYDTD